jgi:methyl-accepting chemotaxis protein
VGQASTQIAKAIQDIARGASDQSKSSTEMLQQVTALNLAVTQVAEGVESQRAMSSSVIQSVIGMDDAVLAASDSLHAVTTAAGEAVQRARDGGTVVSQRQNPFRKASVILDSISRKEFRQWMKDNWHSCAI